MTATIHHLPSRSRPRPVDDGSVMSAAELLAWHEERIVSGRAEDTLGDFIRGVWGAPRHGGDGPGEAA